jgi:hypothetical protein
MQWVVINRVFSTASFPKRRIFAFHKDVPKQPPTKLSHNPSFDMQNTTHKLYVRATGLNHLVQELQPRSTDGYILCHGIVRELVVMRHMAGIGVPMLVGDPFAVAWGNGWKRRREKIASYETITCFRASQNNFAHQYSKFNTYYLLISACPVPTYRALSCSLEMGAPPGLLMTTMLLLVVDYRKWWTLVVSTAILFSLEFSPTSNPLQFLCDAMRQVQQGWQIKDSATNQPHETTRPVLSRLQLVVRRTDGCRHQQLIGMGYRRILGSCGFG